MAKILPNAFTTVEFSPEEELEAKVIPPLFRLYLLSLRGEVAHQKINLRLDQDRLQEFIQNEAFLAGKLELLTQLIGEDSGFSPTKGN